MGFRDGVDPDKRQLLVEGLDACAVVIRLLETHGIQDVQVHDFGGIHQLGDYLGVLLKQRPFADGVRRLGILRDAEDQPAAAARASIHSTLIAAGVEVGRSGLALTGIRSYVLPDDAHIGCLETLLYAARRDRRVDGCVEAFVECAWPEQVPPLGTRPNTHKIRVQAHLAALAPDKRSGQALGAGLFDPRDAAFSQLIEFLQTF